MDFKSFEELHQSIKKTGEKWIAANSKADRNSQYNGLWAALTDLEFFLRNERRDYEDKLSKLKSTYAPQFLADKRRKLDEELNRVVTVTTDVMRDNIKHLHGIQVTPHLENIK